MMPLLAVMQPDLNAPKRISGLQRLLESTNVTMEAGSRVVTAIDRSGNARNYTQTTGVAGRPTQTASIMNGRPGIRFDGTDDFLSGGTNKDLVNTAAYTGFIVFQRDAYPGSANYYEQILNIRTDSASFSVNLILLDSYAAYSSKEVMVGFGGAAIIGAAGVTTAGVNTILIWDYNTGVKGTASSHTLFANNASQTLTATTTWTVQDVNEIGRYPGGGGSGYAKIYLMETGYYNKQLSATEKRILQIYLQRKYNKNG